MPSGGDARDPALQVQQPAGRFQSHERQGQPDRDRKRESFNPEHDVDAAAGTAVVALAAGKGTRVIEPVERASPTCLTEMAFIAKLFGGPLFSVAAILGLGLGHIFTIRPVPAQSTGPRQYLDQAVTFDTCR